MEPLQSEFGHLADGRTVQAWTLGSDGLTATILNYGARIASLGLLLGKRRRNVVLGFADFVEYATDRACLGAVCGRYANRIAGGAVHAGRTAHSSCRATMAPTRCMADRWASNICSGKRRRTARR